MYSVSFLIVSMSIYVCSLIFCQSTKISFNTKIFGIFVNNEVKSNEINI